MKYALRSPARSHERKWSLPTRLALALLLTSLSFADTASADYDRDGLHDAFEQALLTKFVPLFHISPSDCDSSPAEFLPNTPNPIAKARNNTIYAQAFPLTRPDGPAEIELHYYHLWTRDCGQPGHALDAESVSVLLRSDFHDQQPEKWTAVYWRAAAHENTLCDMTNAGPAEALNAVHHGPDIWISSGKHASFLNKDLCLLGCGRDRCESTAPARISQIVNIGEPNAPINGADWIASPQWPLASKMESDFTDPVLARLSAMNAVALIPARDVPRGTRTTLKVADRTYGSLTSALSDTEAAASDAKAASAAGVNSGLHAVSSAAGHATNSGRTALKSVRKSLKSAVRRSRPKPRTPAQ